MAIGFFTERVEYDLPHPPIHPRILMIISKVIQRAWLLINDKPPAGFSLDTADEDTITQILVEVIENRLRKHGEVQGFNCALFGKVSREPKITNFDKKHPDKMPDIFFDLKRDNLSILSDQDGLFIECKPVDRQHPIYSCYCQKGLRRFVDGDYAWAMQDAMMIGYASTPYTLNKLSTTLSNKKNDAAFKMIDEEHRDGEHYSSTHNRDFFWLQNSGVACPIKILHLWLSVENT